MYLNLFKDLFSSFSPVSRLAFEVWDASECLFSTAGAGAVSIDPERVRKLSGQAIAQASFQHSLEPGQVHLFSTPVENDEGIIGALIAYGPSSPETLEDSYTRGIEVFLTRMAELLIETWNTQKELTELTEELTRNFEDLHLFARIATQINTLKFSSVILKDLIKALRETKEVDLAFADLPEHPDFSTLIGETDSEGEAPRNNPFVRSLIETLPRHEESREETYIIVNNSASTPGYMELHDRPYRFLAAKMLHNDNFYGWLGLVSFDLDASFHQSELRLLESVASSSATALENSRLYAESITLAEKERIIRNIFQKYVPEEVANEILDLDERDLISLGEKRLVTLLNIDIRGYSQLSKEFKAEDLVGIINYFFMEMGTVILNHKGILDKYLGDGLLAVFGAPVASDNPALDATLAAIEMVRRLRNVNQFTHERFGIPLHIGISINTGETIVGNIGFEKKMEYTVIGDVVNDTFRLQELTREIPNSILISHTTYQRVEPHIITRSLGERVLGHGEGRMEVYEVLGGKK